MHLRDPTEDTATTRQPVRHEIVTRKALYANGGYALSFRNMTVDESAQSFSHATRPEFTCRFRWEPGSIALWDNRCTQHNPVNDDHGFRRVMH